MILTEQKQKQRKKSRHVIGVSAFICSLLASLVAEAKPVSVFGIGNKFTPGLPSELYRFNENGPIEQRWDIPESRFGLSLTTDGTSLYVAEFGQAINRYDLNGAFLGQFADVSSMAGPSPNSPKLESDVAGSVYTTFGGQSSQPRTSFRLDQNGNISEAFSHANLVFPRGIDAAANGDVYILNSGLGERLFKFSSDGTYIRDFPIPQADVPSDIAINELTEELYMADEFDQSIHVYDLSTGVPTFSDTISLPGNVSDVFVEPITGRIFGTYYTIEEDETIAFFLQYSGFEVSRSGSLLHTYAVDAIPSRLGVSIGVRGIVAVVVPEPASTLMVVATVGFCLLSRQPSRVYISC